MREDDMGDSNDDMEKGWLADIEELNLRKSLATQMGGPENLARHQAAGRLNVRRQDGPLHRYLRHLSPAHGQLCGCPWFYGRH